MTLGLEFGVDYAIRVYGKDAELWAELGLPRRAAANEWVDLGTVEHRPGGPDEKVWAEIRIEACAMPARFWRFTIEGAIEDVHPITLETGSGTLSDFWPTVLLFAGGLLVAREID